MKKYRLRPDVLKEAARTGRRMLTTINGEHIAFAEEEVKVTMKPSKNNPKETVRPYGLPTQLVLSKLMEENPGGWSWIIEEEPEAKSDVVVKQKAEILQKPKEDDKQDVK